VGVPNRSSHASRASHPCCVHWLGFIGYAWIPSHLASGSAVSEHMSPNTRSQNRVLRLAWIAVRAGNTPFNRGANESQWLESNKPRRSLGRRYRKRRGGPSFPALHALSLPSLYRLAAARATPRIVWDSTVAWGATSGPSAALGESGIRWRSPGQAAAAAEQLVELAKLP